MRQAKRSKAVGGWILGLVALCVLPFNALAATESRQAGSLEVFLDQFKTAFLHKDPQLAHELFNWEGLNPQDRDLISDMIDHDLDKQLIGLQVYTPSEDQLPNRRRNLNVEVQAQLLARFVDQSGQVHHSLHQLGLVDGRYFIGLARSIRPGAIVI